MWQKSPAVCFQDNNRLGSGQSPSHLEKQKWKKWRRRVLVSGSCVGKGKKRSRNDSWGRKQGWVQLICLTKEVIMLSVGRKWTGQKKKPQICFTHIRVDEWSPKRNDRRKMRLVDTAKERSRQAGYHRVRSITFFPSAFLYAALCFILLVYPAHCLIKRVSLHLQYSRTVHPIPQGSWSAGRVPALSKELKKKSLKRLRFKN